MKNSVSNKKCPFCKNQIPANSVKCPICKMTLIEQIKIVKADKNNQTNSTAHKNVKDNYRQEYVLKNKLKKLFTTIINFLNKKKKILIFSTIAVILAFYITQSNKSDSLERTIYKYEIKNKAKPNFENNIILENQTKDFSNIPEKYIPNGKIFNQINSYFVGNGELTIKNGTSNDAIAKLVPINFAKSVLTIYIRRNSNFSISNIKDGIYKLYFVVGRHYDEDSLIFLQNCSFSVFEKHLTYITHIYQSKENIKTEYSIFEITLHPVIGGTARTDKITKKEFLSL